MNFINQINIPDDAEVSAIILGDNDILIAHNELGPIFDRDVNKDVWLNASLCFEFENQPCVNVTCISVFTKSFIKAREENVDISPCDFEDNELSSIFVVKYQEPLNNLLNLCLDNLRKFVRTIILKSYLYLIILSIIRLIGWKKMKMKILLSFR